LGRAALDSGASAQLHGAIEDHWRYAQAATVASGTIEVQRMLVARDVLGEHRRKPICHKILETSPLLPPSGWFRWAAHRRRRPPMPRATVAAPRDPTRPRSARS